MAIIEIDAVFAGGVANDKTFSGPSGIDIFQKCAIITGGIGVINDVVILLKNGGYFGGKGFGIAGKEDITTSAQDF